MRCRLIKNYAEKWANWNAQKCSQFVDISGQIEENKYRRKIVRECVRERDMGMVTKCVCRRGVDGGKRFSNGVPITGRERQSVWGGEVSLTLWAHTHHPPPSLHPALHHSAPPPLLPHTLHHLVPDLPAHTYLFSLPGVRATGHRLWQTTTHTHPSPSYTLTVRTQRPHCSSTFLLFDIIKKKSSLMYLHLLVRHLYTYIHMSCWRTCEVPHAVVANVLSPGTKVQILVYFKPKKAHI